MVGNNQVSYAAYELGSRGFLYSLYSCLTLIYGGPQGGLRKHPFGRVDQLEDRYLGMVEAPSSNLGTSTLLLFDTSVDAPEFVFPSDSKRLFSVQHSPSARPPLCYLIGL